MPAISSKRTRCTSVNDGLYGKKVSVSFVGTSFVVGVSSQRLDNEYPMRVGARGRTTFGRPRRARDLSETVTVPLQRSRVRGDVRIRRVRGPGATVLETLRSGRVVCRNPNVDFQLLCATVKNDIFRLLATNENYRYRSSPSIRPTVSTS